MLFAPMRSLYLSEPIEPCIEGCFAGFNGDSDGGAAGNIVSPSYWVKGPQGEYVPHYFE
eukprot:CAMPEP_0181324988 /NCGR_PEP_ID=MMETSP1101-20121128/20669_1 /TAXON_ID=46948 /ORGANISM="Rhodomonas abbreviata, Strain Caron Lab Isolate" /LENGTH=58 /DNA_ID=CAMNT_0023433233 /DNA_START=16 /DNA_END=192 /DNA_ORIENTATION=+